MKISRFVAVFTVCCLVVVGNAFANVAEWTTKLGDAGRTGQTSSNLDAQKNRIAQIFKYTLPASEKATLFSPVFADGKAYFTSDITKGDILLGSKIYCIDAEKGTTVFSRDLDSKGATAVTYYDGRIYLCTLDKPSFVCLDAKNGNKVWQIQTAAIYPKYSPVASNGLVYFCAYNNNVYAYDAKSGKSVWIFTAEGPIKTSPCVSDGKLIVGADDWKVYCIDAKTGNLDWKYFANADMTSPQADKGKTFFATTDGFLFCIDIASGFLDWKYEVGQYLTGVGLKDGKVIACANAFKEIHCIDIESGKAVWKFKTSPTAAYQTMSENRILASQKIDEASPFTIMGDKVFCDVFTQGMYYMLNLKDGTVVKTLRSDNYYSRDYCSTSVVHNGKIYFTNAFGFLFCLDSASDNLRFTINSNKIVTEKLELTMDVPPTVIGGKTYLPAKYILEPLGGNVAWFQRDKKVTCRLLLPGSKDSSTLKENIVEMWVGKPNASVNGDEILMMDPKDPNLTCKIIKGRTMVPFRFLCEALGCNVSWDAETKTITVVYNP